VTPTPTPTPTVTPTVTPTPTVINVMTFGARGDGIADDTVAITTAMAAAANASKSVYVPAGTYSVRTLAVPDGVSLQGAGVDAAWIKGHVVFGSNQDFADLKIGDAGVSAIFNAASSVTNTSFTRCRFRGGGGSPGGTNAPVVYIGQNYPVSYLTFSSCEFECALGTEGLSFDNCYNCVTVQNVGAGSLNHHIAFNGCTFGVSNGVRSGSVRMGLEVVDSSHSTSGGFHDITMNGCTVEFCDAEGVDFSDYYNVRATGIVVENCTIKGAGVPGGLYGNSVCMEFPYRFVFRNNVVYRSMRRCFTMDSRSEAFSGSGATITGNTFDFTVDNGATFIDDYPIQLRLDNNIFTGNTIKMNFVPSSNRAIRVRDAEYNDISHNTYSIGSASLYAETDGSANNTYTDNTGI